MQSPTLKSLALLAVIFAIIVPIALYVGREQDKQLNQQYHKSLTLYSQGNYAAAEQAIRTRMDMVAGDSFAPFYYQLGRCLLQEGQTSDALLAFQKAADEGNGYWGGRHSLKWIPADPVIEHKAQAALAWIHQNPNWQPPAPGQTPASPGPPLDFPPIRSRP